jgi:hypothetical protein
MENEMEILAFKIGHLMDFGFPFSISFSPKSVRDPLAGMGQACECADRSGITGHGQAPERVRIAAVKPNG